MRGPRSDDRAQRGLGLIPFALGLGLALGLGCAGLNYPEPPADAPQNAETNSTISPRETESVPHQPDDDESWTAYSRAGREALRLQRYDDAVQAYLAAFRATATLSAGDARARTAATNLLRLIEELQRHDHYRRAGLVFETLLTQTRAGHMPSLTRLEPLALRQAQDLDENGQSEAAIALQEQVLSFSASRTRPTSIEIDLRRGLARLYLTAGRVDRAAPLLELALRQTQKREGTDSPAEATVLVDMAQLRRAQHRLEEAEEEIRRALAILHDRAPKGPGNTVRIAVIRNELAWVLLERGNAAEASKLAEQALDALPAADASLHETRALVLDTLAGAQAALGHTQAAETHYREAIELGEGNAPDHPMEGLDAVRRHYSDFLQTQDREREARVIESRATPRPE